MPACAWSAPLSAVSWHGCRLTWSGFLLMRTLETCSLSFCCCLVASVMSDFVTPWTVAHQTPLSIGPSRQEYWSGLPCPPPGDLPHPGIEPESLISPALAGAFFATHHLGNPIETVGVSHSESPGRYNAHLNWSRWRVLDEYRSLVWQCNCTYWFSRSIFS